MRPIFPSSLSHSLKKNIQILVISSSEKFLPEYIGEFGEGGYQFFFTSEREDAEKIIKSEIVDLFIYDAETSKYKLSSFAQTIANLPSLTEKENGATVIVISDSPLQLSEMKMFRNTFFFVKGRAENLFNIESVLSHVQNNKIVREKLFTLSQSIEEMASLKVDFMNNMNHEIRTPMNGIMGFADLLLGTPLNEIQKGYVGNIQNNGTLLMTLMSDLLDYSRLDSGRIEFESVDFDLELMAYNVCEMIMPDLELRPIELICRIGEIFPALIIGDPGRFRQVITNLMGNASKFTDCGEIELRINVQEETERDLKIWISVRDTGIGVTKEKQQIIFEPFEQVDASRTRKYGGFGLGLPLCRKIARMLGGDVWVESPYPLDRPVQNHEKNFGPGAIFHFTAWTKKSDPSKSRRREYPDLKGKRALIVESNPNNLELIRKIFDEVEMRMEIFHGLTDIQNNFSSTERGVSSFDFGLIDLGLETISGLKISEFIRNCESSMSKGSHQARIPLIALSVSARGDAFKYRESGFDGILPKPLHRNNLLHLIAHLLSEEQPEEKREKKRVGVITQHTVREGFKHSVRILLVEDSPVNRKLTITMLSKAGYKVFTATNGKECVDMIIASPQNYDLILMDIQMPVMDGIEAAKVIRKLGFKDIPIVAVTANAMNVDKRMCLEAGMNDFLPKPIRRDTIFSMIEKWLIHGNK